MTIPQIHPLTWPAGRIRRGFHKTGQFKYKDGKGWMQPITVAKAVGRLQDEVWKLGGRNLLISSNLLPGKDGLPLSKQPRIDDPGVCAYFSLNGHAMAMACDTFTDAAQNMAALAAHIEAVRAQERYGVASAEESLRAFEALPPPRSANRGGISWRVFFPNVNTIDELNAAYRDAARKCVSEDRLKNLNIARDEARKELGA